MSSGAAAIVLVAGLMGAAGVALGAVAAHRVADPGLATASLYLVIHAAAALALAAVAGHWGGWPWLVTAAALQMGAVLFAGDIAARAFAGARLFPFAAPLGGSLMIGGWALVALAAFVILIRRG
jgi:uncharacterized membrane protein YgdD (TMEM256/DUF423 family)